MTGSIPLIFLLGTLIGALAGGALCVRYLRQEIAANIGPRLRRLQLQLDSLESAVNLVLATRYAEIGSQQQREALSGSSAGAGRREHLPADPLAGPPCPSSRTAADRPHRPSASRVGLSAPDIARVARYRSEIAPAVMAGAVLATGGWLHTAFPGWWPLLLVASHGVRA